MFKYPNQIYIFRKFNYATIFVWKAGITFSKVALILRILSLVDMKPLVEKGFWTHS